MMILSYAHICAKLCTNVNNHPHFGTSPARIRSHDPQVLADPARTHPWCNGGQPEMNKLYYLITHDDPQLVHGLHNFGRTPADHACTIWHALQHHPRSCRTIRDDSAQRCRALHDFGRPSTGALHSILRPVHMILRIWHTVHIFGRV
jgi:hypothetical protein